LKLSTILEELRTEKQAIEKVIAAFEALNENKPELGSRTRLHWTQRPENRTKVQRIMRAAQKARAR
jgi:hypothetical protein